MNVFSKKTVVAGFVLAALLTFGCSSKSGDDDPPPQGKVSSTSAGTEGSSSSVAGDGNGSSSSNTGNGDDSDSSSSGAENGNSSSSDVLGKSSSSGGGTDVSSSGTVGTSSSSGDDKQTGKKKVPVTFVFRNAATNAAAQTPLKTGLKAVAGPGGKSYEVDEESFGQYTTFYNTWLGGDSKKVGTGITPTMLKLPVSKISLYGDHGNIVDLIGSSWLTENPLPMVDFAKGATVTLDEIEAGTYSEIDIWIRMGAGVDHSGNMYFGEIAFPWPEEMDALFDAGQWVYDGNKMNPFQLGTGNYNGVPITHTTVNGKKTVTAPVMSLLPDYVESMRRLNDDDWIIDMSSSFTGDLYYYGRSEKIGNVEPNKYKLYPQGIVGFQKALVVPCEPIVIPENAKSVTFEIRWDLTNIIQQYMGRKADETLIDGAWKTNSYSIDNVANDENDLFVLRNGFWEGFSVTATVQY